MVRVLDLISGTWTNIEVGHRAEHMYFDPSLDQVLVSLAVKEHSVDWPEADQSGYLARIDAATLTALAPVTLPRDPWQIQTNGAGYAFIEDASGQSGLMMVVDLTTGATTTPGPVPPWNGSFYGNSMLVVPDKTRLYDLGANVLSRFDVAGTTFAPPVYKQAEPYHCLGGAFRMNPQGTALYFSCGSVLQSTVDAASDMVWTGDLYLRWRDMAFRPDGKIAYVVPDQEWPAMNGVYEPVLYAVDTASLMIVGTYSLGAPAERVLASDTGLTLVRVTLGGNPKTEVEVVPYSAL